MKSKLSTFFAVFSGILFLGISIFPVSSAHASGSRELLLRVSPRIADRIASNLSLHPQNMTHHKSQAGLVKLSFATPEDAALALKKIRVSNTSARVSFNNFYRPAMNYRFKKLAKPYAFFLPLADEEASAGDNNMIQVGSEIPEIDPAPESVDSGDDPYMIYDWALKNIGFPTEKLGEWMSDSSIITAVLDTGVDYNHEDLSGAMWRSMDENDENNAEIVGWDFAHNTARPYDLVKYDLAGCVEDPMCKSGIDSSKYLINPGHGTHCAGHVAAVAQNSLGIRGIGGGAQLMALKFFFDEGEENAGQGSDLGAIQAIDYAIEHGVQVINASWGGNMSPEDAEGSELKQALIRAQKAGVIVVVAAGNEGVDQDSEELGFEPSYPAKYDLDNLIVVAAIDQKDQLAGFSNYGVNSVHLAAPGVRILSTISGGTYSDVVASVTDKDGNVYGQTWDGTSMAAPIVAGAVALVWSKYPTEDYRQIRDRILRSTRPVPGLAGKVITGGALNISAALE